MAPMSLYYDRALRPLTIDQWAELFEDRDYQSLAKWYGEGGVSVSTVWLGIDHSFGGETPIIFESMVFGGPYDQAQRRYALESEARAGHDEAVANLCAGKVPWPDDCT